MPHKVARWRKIAISALKQCGRLWLPEVTELTSYEDVLGMMGNYNMSILALKGGSNPRLNGVKNILAIVGSRGRFY